MKYSSSLCQVLGWSAFVRVDGLTYSFLGDELVVPNGPLNGSVNLTNIVVTPTQTVLVAHAGPMQVNLTFLIPIEVRFHSSVTFTFLHMRHMKPGDWVKQSIPFSYMSFTAKSSDGASHAVQVYSDLTGGTCSFSPKPVVLFSFVAEWSSGDRFQDIQWSATPAPNTIYLSVNLENQVLFDEIFDQAEWGTLYYAMQTVSDFNLPSFFYSRSLMQGNGVNYTIAASETAREYFVANGTLNNTVDPLERGIHDNFPAFAISRNLGTIQATQAPVVWAVGYTTDPAVNYTDLSGAPPSSRSPYYRTQYSNDEALASIYGIFWGDYV